MYSIILFMSVMTSCYNFGPCIEGYGVLTEDEREVIDFYGVSNTTSFDVYITQADEYSVVVKAQENILPLIETYKSGGTLIVNTKDFNCIRSTSRVEVYISMPEIEELNLTGSGMIACEKVQGDIVECAVTSSGNLFVDSIDCDELYIKNSGSGSYESDTVSASYIEIKLTGSGNIDFGESLVEESNINHTSSGTIRGGIFDAIVSDFTLTGSGNVIVYGNSEKLDTYHSASGRIDALDLESIDVRTRSSGSGNTYVNYSGSLDVTILGSGSVIYIGSSSNISSRITGSGNLRMY